MLRVLFWLLIVIPIGALVVVLAVANRHEVELILDPFRPSAPALSIPAPLYAFIFAGLFLGLVLGGVASWISQGKWRSMARERTREAYRWKTEADRLLREKEVGSRLGLPEPGRTA
ncbi:MAG: hypothetical protein GC150_00405 [Rhizobiales bacterium]|nr:hypothetical protein [Hyphomicrobiales bacterium]